MEPLQASPISWPPSEYWNGLDGNWSSFALRVGTPPQVVHVLPSTAGQATWLVSSQGCSNSSDVECTTSRGGVFDSLQSETWSNRGIFALGLESGLGYSDNGTYGLDTVALGFSNATGEPSLEGQLVGEMEAFDFPVGLFGLGQQQTNLSTYYQGYPSFLARMKSHKTIPSLSWSYTAGAPYRLKGFFGSLIFGGYDLSRFKPNDVSFSFAPDISRDLVVSLQSITSNGIGQSSSNASRLLSSPIYTFIDSTLPWIYLPHDACEAFARRFGLQFNETIKRYTVSDEQHNILKASKLDITFTLSNSEEGGPTVDIVLPYSSFDLEVTKPLVPSPTRYFPIREAQSENQYTLGRTFLQEAYLTVNYESSNFSVSQCIFEDGVQKDIISIPPANTTSKTAPSAKSNLTVGATVTITLLLLISLLALTIAKRKWQRRKARANAGLSPRLARFECGSSTLPGTPKELGNNSLAAGWNGYKEMGDTSLAELAELGRSLIFSRFRDGTAGSFHPLSSAAISRLDLPSPALKVSENCPRPMGKRTLQCQTCGSSSPLSPASIVDRSLPGTPKSKTRHREELELQRRTFQIISPISPSSSKYTASILDRPLPPTPRYSTQSSYIIEMYADRGCRSESPSEKLTRKDIEAWIKAGTTI